MRRAFYALCTHIDHQIRIVIGTLREEGLLDDTAILFTADHGDMLGNHGLYAKRLFLEPSARVPSFLILPKGDARESRGTVRHDLFGLADVMPTLLDIAGIGIPETCEGISMLGSEGRPFVYGECMEDGKATRMVREGDPQADLVSGRQPGSICSMSPPIRRNAGISRRMPPTPICAGTSRAFSSASSTASIANGSRTGPSRASMRPPCRASTIAPYRANADTTTRNPPSTARERLWAPFDEGDL